MNTQDLSAKLTKKNMTIAALSLTLLVTSGLTAVSAAEEFEERHERKHAPSEELRSAVESKDYTAFQAVVLSEDLPEKLEALTEAQFHQFAEMHELRRAGDTEGAAAIRESLGLRGPSDEKHERREGRREEMKTIFENGDFASWSTHANERGLDASLITEDNFAKLQAAALSGDREEMKAVHETLGFPVREHKGEKGNRGPGKILETDYATWAERAAHRGMNAEQISENTYNALKEAATLAQSGDKEGAKTLLESAGIERPERPARGERQGRFGSQR